MSKFVVFELGDGDFDRGFPVHMQIGEEGKSPSVQLRGKLPPNTEIWQQYQQWHEAYINLKSYYRLSVKDDGQPSSGSFLKDCHRATEQLQSALDDWLSTDSLRMVRERFIARVQESEEVRILIKTEQIKLQRLPWHLWSLFTSYSRAEIAVISPDVDNSIQRPAAKLKIRILAVLGNSDGINIQADETLLKQLLPTADVKVLRQPQIHELTEQLWDRQGWDILFFAGHSASAMDGDNAWIEINQTDTITVQDLKRSLRTAIENGLKLAIFNSCDGLGLARALADLQIPQVIVMRELVPDQVANAFLRYFLEAFVRGERLYYAVKEARGRLEGLERQFPCATWLPVIYQICPDAPLSLKDWIKQRDRPLKASIAFATSLMIGGLIVGTRLLGLWQWLDLQAYDHLLRLRDADGLDNRIVIVRITLNDQDSENKTALKNETWFALLSKLKQAKVVGLDVYRNGLQGKERENWVNFLKRNPDLNIYGACERPNNFNKDGKSLSPGLDKAGRSGFSNASDDLQIDRVFRRQIVYKPLDGAVTQDLQKNLEVCPTEYALSFVVANNYLKTLSEQFKSKDFIQSWQWGGTPFTPVQPRYGGYQTIAPDGFQVLLNYRTPLEVGQSPTVQEVIQKYPPSFFKDKIVLIGADIYEEDRTLTPYNKDIAGVFAHAQMVSHLLDVVMKKRPLIWVWDPILEAIWIVGWAMAGGALVWWIRSPLILLVSGGILLGILYGGCFYLLQNWGGWIPLLPAATAFGLTTGSSVLYVATQAKRS